MSPPVWADPAFPQVTQSPPSGPAPQQDRITLTETEKAWLQQHPVIRVAQDPNRPPVAFCDSRGQQVGINCDILKIIEPQLGITFQPVDRPIWQETDRHQRPPDTDMTTLVSTTAKHQTSWSFTKSFLKIPIIILTRTEIAYIPDMSELNGEKVAVVDGYVASESIPKDYPKIHLTRVKTLKEGLDRLRRGEVFALIDNMLVIGYYLTELQLTDLRIAGQTPYIDAQCLAVRKDWPILTEILQKALETISESEKDKIYKRWVPIPRPASLNYRSISKLLALFIVILSALAIWNRRLSKEVRQREQAETALRKSQEELRRSEERLRQIYENSPIGYQSLDVAARLVDVNPAWVSLCGFHREDVIGHRLDEFFTPLSRALFIKMFPIFLKKGVTRGNEFELQRKDGKIRIVSFDGVFLYDEHGRPYHSHCALYDITERKRADTFRQLSNTVLTIINSTVNFRDAVQEILRAIKQVTGADALGIRLRQGDDFPYYAESGFSADFLCTENSLTSYDAKGQICRHADGSIALGCTCGLVLSGQADASTPLFSPGGSFWTNNATPLLELPADEDARIKPRNRCIHDGFLSVALIPIRAKNEIVGLLHINARKTNLFSSDLIEALEGLVGFIGETLVRVRAEEEHERLIAAIEQSSETVLITDPDGTIRYVNPAFCTTTGYSREEIIGQNPRILKSDQQDERFYQHLWQTISHGGTWKGRFIDKRKDGTLFTEAATISPVRDTSGRIVSYVDVGQDLSDFLRMSAELQQAQKMESVGRLAGGVAHDFNNMLSVILGNTELALDSENVPQPVSESLHEIRKAAKRSADLTRQLLAFARKQTVNPHLLQLNKNVEGMLKMLRRLIGEPIELIWRPETEDSTVLMDPSQIDQLLANLAINARDAISGAGKLTITTALRTIDATFSANHIDASPGTYIELRVSDTGTGMDKKTLEHVFEPFFTTKETGKGTGLGLATVYGIVKQNGGFIIIETEAGHGTTFRIFLPHHEQPAEPAASALAVAETPPPDHETVLLVEDEPTLLNMTRKMLENLGYRVLAANLPSTALALAEENAGKIQILLSDVIMPEMNGMELASRVSTLFPSIKVLLMSGYTSDIIIHEGGADEKFPFIQKPFTIQDLANKLRIALNAR